MDRPTRVAIVADSPMFRAGLEAMLGADASLAVAGAMAEPHGDDASPRAVALSSGADVVVWVASQGDGAPSLAFLDDDHDAEPGAPAPGLVLLTGALRAEAAARAVRAGASALLPLDAEADALLAAVRAAAAGLVTLPHELMLDLLARGPAGAPRPRTGANTGAMGGPPAPALTPREREVLTLLGDGLPNKAIAPRLGITEHTVKAHVAAIYEKLGAGNRAEAVVAAARAGLVLL